MFACLLTLAVYTGPDTYSVDYYLEKKISWWWKLAEFRRPVQEQPVPVVRVPVLPVAAAANGSQPAAEPAATR